MKAKDNIEEIILKNLKELNDFEPDEGHFERFQAKLKKQKRKKLISFGMVWKVAAAVVFVLLAVNQVNMYFSPNKQTQLLTGSDSEITISTISPEYEEVEFYYTNAINVGLNQWNSLHDDGFVSDEEKKMMDAELAEFETRFKNLQSDLAANPNDERVINAMLEYYQAKLSIINLIVNKLEEVKQRNKSIREINTKTPDV